jgi:hypothetical protein
METQGWAFVTEHAYNIKPFTVNFAASSNSSPGFTSNDIASLKRNIAGLSFLKIDYNPELLVVKGKNEDSIKVSSNGFLFETIKNATTDSTSLKNTLESYARYKFLQTLSAKTEGISVDVQLIPYFNGKPDTSRIKERIVNNTFVTYDKDTLRLRIRNTGTVDVWVNILDMQPNGVINPVLPNRNKSIYPQDLKIVAGGENMTYYVTISPPFGTEVFKIFASKSEINLEDIVTTKGATSRGGKPFSSLEKLVNKSYTISRGADSDDSANENADATISDLVFLIKPGTKR